MEPWSIGVDLGGTKLEVAHIDAQGRVRQRLRKATNIKGGPAAIIEDIIGYAWTLREGADSPPAGVGVGVAGQVEKDTGKVIFAPNLDWRDVPLQAQLQRTIGLPVIVTNDVRAATWGEWLHGAGQGCDDLLCMFVGTGVGGGVVSGGRMLAGCNNTAGEVGHITVDMNGPPCTCGNRGCLEALAGGWAITRLTRESVKADPEGGKVLLEMGGGGIDEINVATVARAVRGGDPMARRLMDQAAEALIAGASTLINAFNPCRLILGGGVITGVPELISRIDKGVRGQALAAACSSLMVLPAGLRTDAGVIGAAALAIRTFSGKVVTP
ncbi:MAG TPA: ROK family protein [Geobacteraceae bacterium]|nr:ROK family protein [Geobacteraceae bacterium]